MPVKTETPPAAPARRGRPPRIDRDRIVAAALELGLHRFSLDEIAERLGVSTPALYRHVDGRDDIVRSGAVAAILEIEPDLADLDRWDDWLQAWATGIRDRLGAVGEEVLESVRTQVGQDALRVADHGLRLLTDAGLPTTDAAYTLWLSLRIACTAGPASEPSVTGPLAMVIDEDAPSAEMADAIASVGVVGGADSWRFDLEVLIAGIAARLECLLHEGPPTMPRWGP